MFSIASVMLFGAIVVNLYQQTGESYLSRSSRRKLIRTLGPLVRVRMPEHLLNEMKQEDKAKHVVNRSNSSTVGCGVKYIPEVKYTPEVEYRPDMVRKTETEPSKSDPKNLEVTIAEWQTVALIMDRVFLLFWAVSNLVTMVTVMVLLRCG